MRGRLIAGTATLALAFAAPAAAQDTTAGKGDFGGFRNVLPGGQGETVNAPEFAQFQAAGTPPATYTNQLALYTDLVQAAPALSAGDLDAYFKPETFGVPAEAVDTTESPRAGVTIIRDKPYRVPHVYGETRGDTMFGVGYASAEDRLFLMDVLRHTGRATLTELIGPGDGDSTVKMDAEQLKIADYSEEELQGMIDQGVADAGPEGAQTKQDLLDYVAGINQYIAEARTDLTKLPAEYPALGKMPEDWKPTDTVAVASLIGGIFGRGGGAEGLASQALQEATKRFGQKKGRRVFQDFRRRDDAEAPTTVQQRFPFDDPGKVKPKSLALPDLGSIESRDPAAGSSGAGAASGPSWLRDLQERGLVFPRQQSNALLVTRQHSKSGRPVAVMGPQVGYYSPQILMEVDMHGPGIDARGATFPGISLYVLLGRGQDFAWSATTATTDVVDEFVEKLCEPDGSKPTLDSKHYLYKGKCIPILQRDHVLTSTPSAGSTTPPRVITLKVERTVHGPVQARATVGGQPVVIAEARSTYFHELDSAIAFKRLCSNEVHDAKSFQQAMNHVNFAFNWFYVDDRDIAYLQSGWYPRRHRGTHPDLPAWGTGEWDWKGFNPGKFTSARMPFRSLPKAIDPKRGYLISWNNKQAPGWRAADDNWFYSSVHRSERLEVRVKRAIRGRKKIDLAGLTQAMATAATVDLRGQEVYPWLRRVIGRTKDAEAAPLLALLDSWRKNGAHRRDMDRDNVYDESAAVAVMDAWWDRLMHGMFEPRLGKPLFDAIEDIAPLDQAPDGGGSSFFSGWWGYVDKDLRSLLGRRVRDPLRYRYCGGGSLKRCRAVLLATLKQAGAAVRERFGSADTAAWRVPATCEEGSKKCDQIEFLTAGAVGTPPIPWQDRPTFQQVVEVQGHRPR